MAKFVPGQIVEVRGTVIDYNGVCYKIEFVGCHPLSKLWFGNDSPEILRAHEPPFKVGDTVTWYEERVIILAIVGNRCWIRSIHSLSECLAHQGDLKRSV